ncbi:MAG: RNA polymerase sigma factor [Actinobacteria bacterium]|nr:RNA polymerase sigma factor [Actinomycetota bacterium]
MTRGGARAGSSQPPRERCGKPVQPRAANVGVAAVAGDAVTLLAPLPAAGTASRGDGVGTFRSSDQAAVEELFNACYPRLAGWVRRLVDDDDTAHEIASEAFTRLLARWTSLDNPQSYLYMIATNLVRDHWRKAGRERRALRTAGAGAAEEAVHHPAQDVDVRALIQALPDRLRKPFLLHYYGGYPVRDVAALLGRPEGTIKADLHHARARLRAALGEADG